MAKPKKRPVRRKLALPARKVKLKKAETEVPQQDGFHRVKVRVVGVGGGGSSIAGEVAARVSRADFVVCNTDSQALKGSLGRARKFLFGQQMTKGLGCGMDADLGEEAAKAEKERIKKVFEGQDLCVIISALGGGTGSGAAPVFCQAAKEAGCLTLGVFTLPFQFEGEKRQAAAAGALERVQPFLNAYVVIPNEHIFQLIDRTTSLKDAFSAVNKRLAEALEGLVETIFLPGVINTDFADLQSVLEGRGKLAYLNSAKAGGPQKTQEALKQIMTNPLLSYGPEGAERILFTIASDRTMKMHEVAEVSSSIANANPKAKIIFGLAHYPKLRGKLQVTFFAVGCRAPGRQAVKRKPARKAVKQKQEPEPEVRAEEKAESRKSAHSAPKQKKKRAARAKPKAAVAKPRQRRLRIKARRNGLEVKKAVDRELQELQEREKAWEIPAFLRNI